ncbi:MAG: 50S ribosomal protein L25/general stress protein Ctc [Proteobacteria bacterium]|nr:50S ribosomal protein L25/general stress protein Ctc [Pseudomonadota bacterium]
MSANVLQVEIRNDAGKGAARAARREGKVPAIIYGAGEKQVMLTLNARELGKELAKPGFRARAIELKAGKETFLALPREVQYHPVTDAPEHVDFLRLKKGEAVHVFVKVNFINADKAPGIRRGGVLNIVRHDVELICLPEAIPTSITVDLTGLEIGRSVHASSVKLPKDVKYAISTRDFTIATVAGRMAEEVETAAPTASIADVQATAQKAPEAAAAGAPAAAGAKAPAAAAGAKAPAAAPKADAKK